MEGLAKLKRNLSQNRFSGFYYPPPTTVTAVDKKFAKQHRHKRSKQKHLHMKIAGVVAEGAEDGATLRKTNAESDFVV